MVRVGQPGDDDDRRDEFLNAISGRPPIRVANWFALLFRDEQVEESAVRLPAVREGEPILEGMRHENFYLMRCRDLFEPLCEDARLRFIIFDQEVTDFFGLVHRTALLFSHQAKIASLIRRTSPCPTTK